MKAFALSTDTMNGSAQQLFQNVWQAGTQMLVSIRQITAGELQAMTSHDLTWA